MVALLRLADHELLHLINSWHSPWLDALMLFASARTAWLSGYLVLALALVYHLGRRAGLLLPLIGAAVGLADVISSRLIKPFFHRLRPSHTVDLAPLLHLPDGPGGLHGFLSSHAANVAVLATILCLVLAPRYRVAKGCLVAWAALVCLSRVYLGVHYPSDVLGGILLGTGLGAVGAGAYQRLGQRLALGTP